MIDRNVSAAPSSMHLEPYVPEISRNFEIPVHIGRMIAHWSSPEFVSVVAATHMREEDYVVGLVHRSEAVAFPLWVTDYYHVVNCTIAGDPVMFTTCERCQSGSAFLSVIDGKKVTFSATGMYNASLTLTEKSGLLERQGSTWLHYEGVCIHGRHQGKFLTQIPSFHMTWAEWKQLHPETCVMQEPEDPLHEDARHGHGREEYFSRPGMDPPLIQTITGDLDERYPENEMVLGINTEDLLKAWPLREVHKNGGVVQEQSGETPVVVFAGPAPHQITMSAFCAQAEGHTLTFHRAPRGFRDRETNSLWTIEGAAIEGPLVGSRLTPLRWQYVRWHAWFYPHRSTQLYRCEWQQPSWPQINTAVDASSFGPILNEIAVMGCDVTLEHEVYHLCLPHEAVRGIVFRVDGERHNLFQFESIEAAEDYVTLNGAWFCHPIGLKVGKKFSRRFGTHVLESDPDVQYEGPSQFVRLPDPQIRWSNLLNDSDLFDKLNAASPQGNQPAGVSIVGLLHQLKRHGYDVIETAFLPHTQLRTGTVSAVSATINADRFAIYKCHDATVAKQVAEQFSHSLQAGPWVIRSTPAIMFQDPCYEMGQLPEHETRWSPLVEQARFRKVLNTYLDPVDRVCHAA